MRERPTRLLAAMIAFHLLQAAWVVAADMTPPHLAVLDYMTRAVRCAAGVSEHGPGILGDPMAAIGIALGEAVIGRRC